MMMVFGDIPQNKRFFGIDVSVKIENNWILPPNHL